VPELEQISLTDWARFAAYLDGEGCILITFIKNSKRPRGYHQLQLRIVNSDPRLLHWLRETFGGYANPCAQKNKLSNRPNFYWGACAAAAEELLRRCYPFLIIKKEQADIALAFRETFAEMWDTRRSPEETTEKRQSFKRQLSETKKAVPPWKQVFIEE
jgi:hypothetical protein